MSKLMRAADAVVGGFTVGERAWKGETLNAVAIGAALAVPLLWKKRLGTLAIAAAIAALSYYFAEELHEDEPILVEAHKPVDGAGLN